MMEWLLLAMVVSNLGGPDDPGLSLFGAMFIRATIV